MNVIELAGPYAERPTNYLGMWTPGGWRLKLYEIAFEVDHARPELLEAAKEAALIKLPSEPEGDGRYGVGFLGVHDGKGGAFGFLDWWADENELHHHLWVAPKDEPTNLVYATPTGLMACVFEMRVIVAEREAWIDTVLNNPDGPDLEAYLARTSA